MANDQHIKLYATAPHPCSYFDDRDAKTLFIDPQLDIDSRLYTHLSQRGFRRSGPHLYKPYCEGCKQCVASRIPVALFSPSRNQRKVINRNSDLQVVCKPEMDEEAYPLYERYINTRHQDGDMYPASREQFDSFLVDAMPCTEYAHFYDGDGQLVAVAVMDALNDGLSAIYTFFDPDLHRRSLGKFAILWQINAAGERQLPYLYLGYWIKNCEKMRYKTDYRPIELLAEKRWVRIN